MNDLNQNNISKTENINNIISYVIIFIGLLIIANTSIFSNNYFILFYSILLILFCYIKKKLTIKIEFLAITFIWLSINIIVSLKFSVDNFELLRITNVFLKIILLPYLLLLFFKNSFFEKTEKMILVLTLISLPLFLLNILFYDTFSSLLYIFKPITNPVFFIDKFSDHFTTLFYVNAIKEGSYYRNCGFMWEPGAFALMIIIMISIKWLREGVKFDFRFLIYTIALLTTLSTAGYVAFSLLFALGLIIKKSFKYIPIVIIFSYFAIPYLNKLDFVGEEIRGYVESYEEDYIGKRHKVYLAPKVNRFMIVKYDWEKIKTYPWGMGVYRGDELIGVRNIVGVNGLSNTLVVWGVPVFMLFLFYLFRFFIIYNRLKINVFFIFFIFICNVIMIFSNPLTYSPILYLLIFTPLFINKNEFATS